MTKRTILVFFCYLPLAEYELPGTGKCILMFDRLLNIDETVPLRF